MKLATAFVEIRPDTKKFGRQLQQETEQTATDVGRKLGQALAGAAFLAGAKKGIDAASDLNEAINVTEITFGKAEGQVADFAKTAARELGLSERAAREAAASFGGLLLNLGFTEDAAADTSIKLTQLASDLGSAFNTDPAEAALALGSALRGEQEPILRYNVLLSDQKVRQEAVRLGLAATTAAVDENGKVQARLSLIMEQTSRIQGDFANTSEGAANAQRIQAAVAEDSAASLGQSLLPVYEKVVAVTTAAVEVFGKLPGPVQTGVVALAGIAALAGPVRAASEAVGSLATIARTRLSGALDRGAVGAYNMAGGAGKLGGAVGALGFVGAAVGAGLLAKSLTETKINVEDLAVATANLTEAQEEQGRRGLLALDSFGMLNGIISDTADTNVAAAQRLVDMGVAAGLTAERVAELQAIVDSKADADVQAAADQQTNTAAVQEAVKPAEDLADAVSLTDQAAQDAAESVDLFREAIEKALGGFDVEEAVDKQRGALAGLADDIEERARAVDEARRRVAELRAVEGDARDPRAIAEAERELAEAIEATSLALDGDTEAARRNRDEVRNLVEDTVGIIEANREQGASLEELQFIRDIERENLRRNLEAMGLNREEIDRYIAKIDEIPITKATTITADTALAEAKILGLLRIIEAVPGSVDAAVADRNLQRLAASQNAAGNPQVSDGLFSVGENGRELLSKRGDQVEVIAGAPRALAGGFDGVGEDQLLTQRQMVRLLEALVANSASNVFADSRLVGTGLV